MTPDATAVHPCVAAAAARKLLRAYISVDWYAATRAHKRHTHLVRPPDASARGRRPETIPAFAKIWHRFAGVRTGAELEWLGPCAGPGDGTSNDSGNDAAADIGNDHDTADEHGNVTAADPGNDHLTGIGSNTDAGIGSSNIDVTTDVGGP